MRMATCSGPEVSHALLKYFHNELQMWLCVYFLLVILIFSLFPSSLLQQTQIHNLDLIKKQRLLIQRRTCRHVTELLSEKPSGKDSLWNTWHPFSKRAAEVPAKPEILHITILILSEERYFQFLPLQLFCRVYGASCCILFSSRVWFIFRRHEFYPWVRKIPWKSKWQPTPVFLPGEFHGERSLEATSYGVAKSQIWLSN